MGLARPFRAGSFRRSPQGVALGWHGAGRWPSLGLYRRLAALPILEARRLGLPFNLSSGVGRFKALRGGEAVMEYLGAYDKHLSAKRRHPWQCIEWLSTCLLAPYVRRHGL